MITVGLVKELLYISTVLKTAVGVTCTDPVNGLTLNVNDNKLNVWYKGNHIWYETIEGDASMFGIESCDSISRIIVCIDNDNPDWVKYRYVENS